MWPRPRSAFARLGNLKRLRPTLGVAASVFVGLAALWTLGVFELLELKSLDHRFFRYSRPARANRDIVVIAIDEASLAHFEDELGRWPWPRSVHGYVVDFLMRGGARSVAVDILFLEPDKTSDEDDDALAAAVERAGNVTLAMLFERGLGEKSGHEAPAVVSWRERAALRVAGERAFPVVEYPRANLPIPKLLSAARAAAYINLQADGDGPSRRLRPIFRSGGHYYASFPLAIAMRLLGAREARFTRRGELDFAGRTIPLNARGEMILNWHGPSEQIYPVYPVARLLTSVKQMYDGQEPDLNPALFKDKIVFIAGTAAGTYDLRVTPYSSKTPGVFIHIAALDNILSGTFLCEASRWILWASVAALCLLTASTLAAASALKVKIPLVLGYAVAYYVIAVCMFRYADLWLEVVVPEVGVFATLLSATLVEYFTEGKRKRQIKDIFQHYMTPSIVDSLLEHPEQVKLGGERKELTVFFSDVAGFTSISETLEPERLVVLLNRYLAAMTGIILHREGFLDKYEGDAIMAVFGAPLNQPRHATLACCAALDSQEALRQLRRHLVEEGYPELHSRIGLNSGPMVVGNMGSEKRMDYTVMGDAVNVGARLEGANKEYETSVLIGETTYALAREDIEAREVDLVRVKGKREPVRVYELMARKGELPPEQSELVKLYLEGLAAYRQREWKGARRLFGRALERGPEDGPSRVYLARCERFLESPPPPEWDGVFELKTK